MRPWLLTTASPRRIVDPTRRCTRGGRRLPGRCLGKSEPVTGKVFRNRWKQGSLTRRRQAAKKHAKNSVTVLCTPKVRPGRSWTKQSSLTDASGRCRASGTVPTGMGSFRFARLVGWLSVVGEHPALHVRANVAGDRAGDRGLRTGVPSEPRTKPCVVTGLSRDPHSGGDVSAPPGGNPERAGSKSASQERERWLMQVHQSAWGEPKHFETLLSIVNGTG